MTVLRRAWAIVWKDLLIEARTKQSFNAMVFFALLILFIFSFALGPDTELLQRVAGGLLWVGIAFTGLLSLSRTYQNEETSGGLERHQLEVEGLVGGEGQLERRALDVVHQDLEVVGVDAPLLHRGAEEVVGVLGDELVERGRVRHENRHRGPRAPPRPPRLLPHRRDRSGEAVEHARVEAAEIDKRVSLHSLRHAFATHLLEHHEDIRVIQVLLGHKKLENTARYSQVAAKLLREVKGPLEYLQIPPPV